MFTDALVHLGSIITLPLFRLLLLSIVKDVGDFNLRDPVLEYYDFIVVGSGPGGGTVGARLSEVEGWNVLVIESGGPPPLETYVPSFIPMGFLPSHSADWGYVSSPQEHGLENMNDRAAILTSGKVVGGGHTINGLQHVRGHRLDFDQWASLGNKGWDYESVLKYFKKLEDFKDPMTSEARLFHGRGGPISVRREPAGDLTRAFLKGGQEMGYQVNNDYNGREQIGFGEMFLNIERGRRSSIATGYLDPASKRPNFHLLHSATVHKIIFDENRRAVAVEFKYKGKIRTVRARREIIVSCGVFGSPKLLMLSGVGPKDHLKKHKEQPRVNEL